MTARDQHQPTLESSVRYESEAFIRRPGILLIRMAPGEEPPELEIERRFVRVLRTRHPIPACTRVRVTRPLVVVVAESVHESIATLVCECARVGAAFVHLGPLVDRAALGTWLSNAVQMGLARRAQSVPASA
jgi:hypothetical protein